MSELERTLQMRINHILHRFYQLAHEQRANCANVRPTTKRRLEYCAEEIEQTLKKVQSELVDIRWIEVE